MTLDQIRYFLAAAEFEHVGKAARSVYISPSAVSAAVAALEREAGRRLFERKRRRIFLTPAGQEVKAWARRIVDDVESLPGAFKRRPALRGVYRLAASHFLASAVLGPAWFTLQRANPELVGELRALESSTVLAEILAGRVDLGVCFNPLGHPELEQTLLRRGSLVLAARKGHPIFRLPAGRRMERLSSYPAVMHRVSQGIDVSQRHAMFDRFRLRPRTTLLYEGTEVAIAKLRTSECWTFIPDTIVAAYKEMRVVAEPPGWQAPCDIKAVRHRNKPLDRALGEIAAELRRRLAPGFSAG